MKRFLFSLILTFPLWVIAQNSYSSEIITESLYEKMIISDEAELIPVIIYMNEEFPTYQLRSQYKSMDNNNRRQFVVNELKTFSKQSQNEINKYLTQKVLLGEVVIDHSFWITNVIKCSATKSIINELALRDDIKNIDNDKISYALFDEVATKAEDQSKARDITYNVLKVNATDVWDMGYTGEGVIVAVLDVGVNYNHIDLATHMWESPDYPNHGYDFAYNDNDPMDGHGHGTHCAGTVAGNGTAGSQTGMAPDATIMALKVLNDGGGGSESDSWEAVEFAIDHGAHVLSMSIGWAHSMNPARSTWRNTMNNALAAGIVASVAAGNEGGSITDPDDVRTPGDCPPPWLNPDQTLVGGISSVVCIGATDENDNLAYFSSLGPSTWETINPYNDYPYNPELGLIRPDVSAPGVDIKSCDAFNINGYTYMSGTSMATPGVAGVMALLLSKNPNITPEMMSEVLETTSIDLGSAGKDNRYGAGRVDAFEAFNEIVDIYPPSALSANTDQETGICTLSWNHNQTEGFEYYRIYRDNIIIDSTYELTITDQLVDYGYYSYSVTAFYGGNHESDPAIKQTQFGSSTISSVPDSLSVTISPETIEYRTLKIKNTGILELTFSLSPFLRSILLPNWLTIDPDQGSIPAGDSLSVNITMNSQGMLVGEYSDQIKFITNDIEAPSYIIPVTMIVSDLEAQAEATPNSICQGLTTQLKATVSGGQGEYTYSWTSIPIGFTSNEPDPIVVPEVSTEYFLVVNDDIANVESSVSITVWETPVVNLGDDKIICGENTILLDAGNPDEQYLWSTDEVSQTIMASGEGNTMFWAKVTNQNNCSSQDTVYINFAELPLINLGSDTTICGGTTITLDAGNTGSDYMWSTGTNMQTYTADTSGYGYGVQNIGVEVTSELGCINNSEINIEFINCTSIDEIEGVDYSIFPVPSDGIININITGKTNKQLNINIYDITGKVIYTQTHNSISGITTQKVDLSSLSKGIYTVTITDGKSTILQKIVIQ